MELKNKSGLEFTDISSEEYREYEFHDARLKIKNPTHLSVSASGGHRVLDAQGISHYIPTGWFHLSWKVKDGQPHFVK